MFTYRYTTKRVTFSTTDKTLVLEPYPRYKGGYDTAWALHYDTWDRHSQPLHTSVYIGDLWADAMEALGDMPEPETLDTFSATASRSVVVSDVARVIRVPDEFATDPTAWTCWRDWSGMYHVVPNIVGSGIDELTLWCNCDCVDRIFDNAAEALRLNGCRVPTVPELVGRLNHPAGGV